MILKEKEMMALKDLQTQEKSCIQKYGKYTKEARDAVLQDLFRTIQKEEQTHYESLEQVISGTVPKSDCNDDNGRNYNPQATYSAGVESEDKANDCYLATDCIATEKLVSSEYNSDVFTFGDSDIRKLLADMQIEEQNHAEMLYKYKTVNGMA